MSIETIVEAAKAKIAEMGGGEQYLGVTSELAETCNVDPDEVFFWIADLGEAMEKAGLKLVVNKANSTKLYAGPKEG